MLEGLTPATGKNSCKVGDILITLEEQDRNILNEALADKRWSPMGLSKALRARGVILGKDTLRTHSEENCRCFKA
jgi:hypothetical protein